MTCQEIKDQFDLEEIGVVVLEADTVEGMAELAWCQLVEEAEKSLPILMLDGETFKAEEVKGCLNDRFRTESD